MYCFHSPLSLGRVNIAPDIAVNSGADVDTVWVMSINYGSYHKSICGLIVGHPLDTIKVRQQTLQQTRGLQILFNTFMFEGFYGFYKGMGMPLLAAGALNSLFFGSYGICLRYLEKYKRPSDLDKYGDRHIPSSNSNIFLAGVGGGIVTCSLAIPVDLIKIQLQSHTGSWNTKCKTKHISPGKTFSTILRRHGLKGVYHGGLIMLYRESISYGIYILTYAELMNYMQAKLEVKSVMLAGGIAGVLCWVCIMPLDVIKTRLQADNLSAPVYKGIIDCAIKSYKKDGILVFQRGVVMCAVRSFPVNAVTFLGYEWSLKWCKHFNEMYNKGFS